MEKGAPIDLDTVGELIAQSEIDFRVLKANIRALLRERSQASIGEVMGRFPATQGLGACRLHGPGRAPRVRGDRIETVEWEGQMSSAGARAFPPFTLWRERVLELT